MINVPFNFEPISVSRRTSSYVIPTGNYAYVVAAVQDGGIFTINGSYVLRSKSPNTVQPISGNGSVGVSSSVNIFAAATDKIADIALTFTAVTGAPIMVIGGQQVVTPTVGTVTYKIGGGDAVNITNDAGSSVTGYFIGYQYNPNHVLTGSTQSFWLPEGTTIDGSGDWVATVSLYNNIS